MEGSLQRITIAGLHGNKTIEANIKDNCLILVGENGSGKTTFLRILFHFLSGRWVALLSFKFSFISAIIDGEEIKVTHDAFVKGFKNFDRHLFDRLPSSYRRMLAEWSTTGEAGPLPAEMERFLMRQGVPFEELVNQMDFFTENTKVPRKDLREAIHKVRTSIKAQVLYLPTYRRIERDLGSIFEDANSEELKSFRNRSQHRSAEEGFIELVEFGMNDVKRSVDAALTKLKEFARENLNSLTLSYLGDVVTQEYENVGLSELGDLKDETIRSVLERIPDDILTTLHKGKLLTLIHTALNNQNPDAQVKIICHYFLKLFHFQQSLKEREKSISAFCELCSEYIVDKRFVYNSATFGFSILPANESPNRQAIALSDLSSGEKQIVSLFSHLYLSGQSRYFVLIDEPELSLSVPWQRRFLTDIRNGGFCAGLVAVTHSPFIYENELLEYAHSLGEFVSI